MNRTLSSVIAIAAALVLGGGLFWMYRSGGPGGWFCSGYGAGGYGMMGHGIGGGMFFLWLIVIIGLVLLVGRLGRNTGSPRLDVPADDPDALEILNRRYARGEIDKAEYLERRKDLAR